MACQYLIVDEFSPVPNGWMDDVAALFEGEMTCCSRGHLDGAPCDRESLVLPMLGMYFDIRIKAREHAQELEGCNGFLPWLAGTWVAPSDTWAVSGGGGAASEAGSVAQIERRGSVFQLGDTGWTAHKYHVSAARILWTKPGLPDSLWVKQIEGSTRYSCTAGNLAAVFSMIESQKERMFPASYDYPALVTRSAVIVSRSTV